jgi:hypothetical protein
MDTIVLTVIIDLIHIIQKVICEWKARGRKDKSQLKKALLYMRKI